MTIALIKMKFIHVILPNSIKYSQISIKE